MVKPVVFISYSHKDEKEKEQLVSHLKVLESSGIIDLWIDDKIAGGADWEGEIKQAIAQASVVVLLISANFLTSKFILGTEVPDFLKRRQREGLIIFPVIAKSCAWDTFDWLTKMNIRPKNGVPVWSGNTDQIDERLATITKEIRNIVERTMTQETVSDEDSLTDQWYRTAIKAFLKGDYWEAKRYLKMVKTTNPFYPRVDELLAEIQEKKSFYPRIKELLLDKLRDPIWQGIGGIIAILALGWSVYTFISQTPDPTPTSVTVTGTPTGIIISPEESTASSPSAATDTPTSSSTPSDITTPSSPPAYSGNLAIPLISGFDSKVYLTSFDGQGINGPNPVSLDAQQPVFSWDGRSILVKATIEDKSGIHKLTASGFNPELSIERSGIAWPVLSPDGQTVMFSDTTLGFRLHIKKPDETIEEVSLRNRTSLSAKNLLWSEDNQLIFQGCATWLNQPDSCGIWITNVNDLEPKLIVKNKDAYPMSARSGSLAYMSKEDGDWEIYILSLDGGSAVKLTDNDFEDGLSVISPNGDGIAYISNESGIWGLWTMSLNGQNKKHWFDIDPGRGTIDIDQWSKERMSWRL